VTSFKEPNLSTKEWVCPLCGTRDKKEVVLIGVIGTTDGNIQEAEQFHLDCIELQYDKEYNFIGQRVYREVK